MPVKNKDLGIPTLNEQQYAPVDLGLFYDKNIQVYWIDGQMINENTLEYTFDKKMPVFSTLHIPIVCRFLYTFDENDDPEEKYKNAVTTVPPPPPRCPETGGIAKWILTSQRTVSITGEYPELPPIDPPGALSQTTIGSTYRSYQIFLFNPDGPLWELREQEFTLLCSID